MQGCQVLGTDPPLLAHPDPHLPSYLLGDVRPVLEAPGRLRQRAAAGDRKDSSVWGTGSGRQGRGGEGGSALSQEPPPPPTWASMRPVLWPLVPRSSASLPALRMLPTLVLTAHAALSPCCGGRSQAAGTPGGPHPQLAGQSQTSRRCPASPYPLPGRGHTWAVWLSHPGQLAIGEGAGAPGQGAAVSWRSLGAGGGHRGEAAPKTPTRC